MKTTKKINSKKAVKTPAKKAVELKKIKTKKLKSVPLKKKKTGTLKGVKVVEVIPTAKAINLKSLTGDELFLHTLTELGKPSLVRDMVANLKDNKRISTTRKKLLAKLYASASHLNRDGVIKRTPVNGSMYEYSLISWKTNKVNWKKSKAKANAA